MNIQHAEDSKRIAKNSIFLLIRLLFLLFISLFTSRVVLDKLGVEDFGVYNVVGGFVGIFSFLKTSFSNVTQRFLNFELGRNYLIEARQIFNQHLILYVIVVILLVIIAETFGLYFVENKLVISDSRREIAIVIYHFSVATICLNILGIVYNSAIIAHENMKIFSYIGMLEGLGKLGIAYMISISPIDKLLLYGFLMMLLQFFVQLFNFVYCRIKYEECKWMWFFKKEETKQTTRYIGWDFVNNIVFVIKDQGVTILLNLFFGPVVNAARALTAQVNMAVSSFSSSFMASVRPQLVKSYANNDMAYWQSLFLKSSKYSLYIMWLFSLPMMICISTVLSIWLKEVPSDTDFFIIWNLLEAICAVLLSPCWTTTLASGKLRTYVISCNTANLMVFPFCYFSFYMGANPVWAYIISFALRGVEVIIAIFITNNIIRFGACNYFQKVILPFILVVLISFIPSYYFHRLLGEGIVSLFVTSIVSTASILISILVLGSTSGERKYFLSFVQKVKQYF